MQIEFQGTEDDSGLLNLALLVPPTREPGQVARPGPVTPASVEHIADVDEVARKFHERRHTIIERRFGAVTFIDTSKSNVRAMSYGPNAYLVINDKLVKHFRNALSRGEAGLTICQRRRRTTRLNATTNHGPMGHIALLPGRSGWLVSRGDNNLPLLSQFSEPPDHLVKQSWR